MPGTESAMSNEANNDAQSGCNQIQSEAQIHDRLSRAIELAEIGTFHCQTPETEFVCSARCKDHLWLPSEANVSLAQVYAAIHPDDRNHTRSAFDACMLSGKPCDIEFRTVSPRGQIRWIRAKGASTFDSGGRAVGFDGVTADVSAQKQLEVNRTQLVKQEGHGRPRAQLSKRMNDTFVATVSHELRGPLATILAWVELLERNATASQITHGLSVIRRSVDMQNRLVNDLLDLSRSETGKFHIERTQIALAGCVNAAVEEARPQAENKGVRLSAPIQSDIVVCGDAMRLQQVFSNLLGNALKFTPKGGSITASVLREGALVQVLITDSGSGISLDQIDAIFEPFVQIEGADTRGGLGLGLAIARTIVELHNGSISAHSEGYGKGAVFSVCLPAEP
jgi:signal transduction histidine kinase